MSGISFEISLEDAVSSAADTMAGSLGSVEQQAKTLESAMTSLEKQMTKATALGDTDKVAELQAKYDAFGGSLEKLGPSAGEAGGSMDVLGESLEAMVDPMALAGAALALAAGLGVLVVAGAKLALEMTELREKTLATFSALGGGKAQGEATLKMLDDLRASTGMTRAELTPLATKLMAMGIQGAALQGQLTALASVKAIGVEGGEEEYLAILKKISGQTKVSAKDLTNLSKTGVNVDEMAKRMGMSVKALQDGLKNGSVDAKKFGAALQDAVTAKGADALAAQANSLTNQWAIFKENLGMLFEGVDAKPFLAGLKDVLGLFSQSTASGRVMKAAVTGTFNAIFSIASKVFPYVKMFIEKLIIGGLKLYIAFKPTIAHLQKLFGSAKGGDGMTKFIDVLVAGILNVTEVVLKTISVLVALYEKGMAVWDAIAGGVKSAIAWFEGLWQSVKTLFSGGASIAGDFVQGLIDGIKNGVSMVVDAAKNLGKSAMDAVKNTLGIHSPSAVMMKLGDHTATGFAQGIAANDNVSAAASGMGGDAIGNVASSGASAPAAAGGSGGGGGGVTINIEAGAIVVGGASAQENVELLEQSLILVLERVALSQGLGSAA